MRTAGSLGKFCKACQAIPAAGYCNLAGCPTAPHIPPSLSDEAEITTDLPAYPLHHTSHNIPHRDDSTLAVGMLGPIHLNEVDA